MNLFLIPPMSCNPIKLVGEQPTWDRLGVTKETVLFEPCEEAHEFIGHCLMIGSAVKFVSIEDESLVISELDKVYVMAHHYPDVITILPGRLVSITDKSTCIQCTHYHPCQ